jgi:hypothetical protein
MKSSKKLLLLSAAFGVLASTAVAQGYDDDDIYYDANKAKKSTKTVKASSLYVGNGAVTSVATSGNTVTNVYTSSPSRVTVTRDVDEYNRRGGYEPVASTSVDDLGDNFEYTRRIERFYNPDLVAECDDDDVTYYYNYANDELADVNASSPTTINIYVDNADPWADFWSPYYYGSAWSWAYRPCYYNPWWRWNYAWGYGSPWSLSFGWDGFHVGLGWGWAGFDLDWGWGFGWTWGGGHHPHFAGLNIGGNWHLGDGGHHGGMMASRPGAGAFNPAGRPSAANGRGGNIGSNTRAAVGAGSLNGSRNNGARAGFAESGAGTRVSSSNRGNAAVGNTGGNRTVSAGSLRGGTGSRNFGGSTRTSSAGASVNAGSLNSNNNRGTARTGRTASTSNRATGYNPSNATRLGSTGTTTSGVGRTSGSSTRSTSRNGSGVSSSSSSSTRSTGGSTRSTGSSSSSSSRSSMGSTGSSRSTGGGFSGGGSRGGGGGSSRGGGGGRH